MTGTRRADGRIGRRGFPGPGQLQVRAGEAPRNAVRPSAPKPSDWRYNVATRIDGYKFRRAGRFRSRLPLRGHRVDVSSGRHRRTVEFFSQVFILVRRSRHNWCAGHRIRVGPRRHGDRASRIAVAAFSRRHHRADVCARCAEIGLMPRAARRSGCSHPDRFWKSAYMLWLLRGYWSPLR